MPKKKSRRNANPSVKAKDANKEHRTPEMIEAMRAVEQTADFDMEACARECSEMQEKLTADYESIELNPSTPESRMDDKVFDIAFDLKPDWLIKNTGSIESLKIYSKLPIDKNDPDFKDSKGQRLVDLTGNSWEDLSDMVEKECRDIMLVTIPYYHSKSRPFGSNVLIAQLFSDVPSGRTKTALRSAHPFQTFLGPKFSGPLKNHDSPTFLGPKLSKCCVSRTPSSDASSTYR